MSAVSMPRHRITRMRQEIRRRTVTVTSVERLTPRMQRIGFASPDLHDFQSPSPDDHIKLFLPATGEDRGGEGGLCMRDYTPRIFDPRQGTLTIDFALHEAGPATAWALAAQVGDQIGIGGPKGSNIVSDDFDWYLLIGDETALPAIGRRIESLRPGVPVTSIVLVESDAEHQTFETKAAWTPIWVSRNGSAEGDGALLGAFLAGQILPAGDGYIWIAAEAQVARTARASVTDILKHPRAWIKASGYWARGQADAHDNLGD